MDRRSFLKQGFFAGALLATSRLPAVEERAPGSDALFAGRGKFERLQLAYAHVKVGAERPFSVLHISDTHLTAAYDTEDPRSLELKRVRTRTFGGRQEDPVTREFIASLRSEPLLKAVLCGHAHISTEFAFSPTAREYVVGGNFLFHGREILFT